MILFQKNYFLLEILFRQCKCVSTEQLRVSVWLFRKWVLFHFANLLLFAGSNCKLQGNAEGYDLARLTGFNCKFDGMAEGYAWLENSISRFGLRIWYSN
ncbi:hypothetical protein PanWU01x14_176380 [Parasponia andersonii]|uniref:Uncharacterized protein n=1 Tax=Parasponia andersonii TaxID=3476 RepID=A0A2P5C7M9_PARAD|nr:hypothetical protein PanWU01x14_176380 [Parasponia andersonii]